MRREATGRYATNRAGGETVRAFVPDPLPPARALDLSGERQALLERAGCQVDARLDAQQALDHLRHAPGAVDLLVTDFNMPGMDGMALVHAVKRLCPDLPIVMASGFVSDPLREQATQLGVCAMVQKERTVEDLVNAVRDVVAGTADQGRAYRAWR